MTDTVQSQKPIEAGDKAGEKLEEDKPFGGQIINNSAIQMDIKPKAKINVNKEDTYETLSKLDMGIKIEDLPETCDVKESLT